MMFPNYVLYTHITQLIFAMKKKMYSKVYRGGFVFGIWLTVGKMVRNP